MIQAVRGPVAEQADGSVVLSITVAPGSAAALFAWLAQNPIGTVVRIDGAGANQADAAPAIQAPVPAAPLATKPPAQGIGLDGAGIAAGQSGAGPRLSPDDQAIIDYARSLAGLAPFQVWVEAQCKRDPGCDSAEHAAGWLLLTAGARTPGDLLTPAGRSKLRAITASYVAWHAQSHPRGGSALDGASVCTLVSA